MYTEITNLSDETKIIKKFYVRKVDKTIMALTIFDFSR